VIQRIIEKSIMKLALISFLFILASTTAMAQEKRSRLVIETDSGNMVIELFNETPAHRDNFLKLAKQGFYTGTSFHRVIENFMIQGGDPNSKEGAEGAPGSGGPGYTIPAEIHPELFHHKGALSAARKGDNVNPNRESSGSQFYIVQGKKTNPTELKKFEERLNFDRKNAISREFFAEPENAEYVNRIKTAQSEGNQDEIKAVMDEVSPLMGARFEDKAFTYTEEQIETYNTIGGTPFLDMQYTVFGQVVDGLDVIDKLASVKKNGESPVVAHRMTIKVIE